MKEETMTTLTINDAVQIRPIAIDHFDAVQKLYCAYYGADKKGACRAVKKLMLKPNRLGFVALKKNACVGFVLGQYAHEEAEIIDILVRENEQNKGVGTLLLQCAIEACMRQNIAKIFLEVAQNNFSAIKLYENAGFAFVGKRDGYYKRGAENIDALIMAMKRGEGGLTKAQRRHKILST